MASDGYRRGYVSFAHFLLYLLKYGIAVHKSHVLLLFDVARRDRKWMLTAPEIDSVNRS